MIKTIAHFADIHVYKSLERHEEYRKVLNQVYKKLEEQRPDRIVVVGDTYSDYIDLEGEPLILIGEILNRFSQIAPVIITRGNHEIRKKNLSRIDTVKTMTDLLQNPKITYYNSSGFYDDENVTWVVWDHVEHKYKGINPWKIQSVKKDKKRIYIDLYHDPIDGCKYHNGYNPGKKQYPSPSDFKGDYSFFGDIHIRQFFSNKTKGFSGSIIQQTFGEEPFGHGYLLWDIEKKEVYEIDIENEHRFIKFEINPGVDYDFLKLDSKHIGKFNKFRVEWTDYAPNITNENENKIKKYLKEKYDATDIEIIPNRLYTDIKDGKMLSEIININDKETQQNIIRQYLKENKFDDEFIEHIIEIDEIVNDRLQLSEARNIIWNIDKFWFSNFKSYGDNQEISWDNVSGIVQISGENQQGKSTILDAICFILYGTTISTSKDEKFGNSRFINKYRKLNYCEGGCILDINGEKYIMNRRVERDIKKGVMKGCPMTIDYYKGTEMIEENKQNDENRNRTQQFLNDVLGDFSDFIRMAFTNSDNLNSMLSMNRSVFIDSIVKDAGYDIFDKKLEEFKEYKKELNIEKINLNENDVDEQIKNISENLKNKENYLSKINIDKKENQISFEKETKRKEDYIRRLHKIDDDILNTNQELIKEKIELYTTKLSENQVNIDNLEMANEYLPSDYNTEYADSINEQYEKFVNEKNDKSLKLEKIKSKINENKNIILNVEKDIENEKINYLNGIKKEIRELEVEEDGIITKRSNDYINKKMIYETLIQSYKTEVDNLKIEGQKIKKEIVSFEEMKSDDNAICPTCNQLISNKDHSHFDGLIVECNDKLVEISKNGKSKLNQIEDVKLKINELEENHTNFLVETKKEYKQKIEALKNQIDDFNVDLIKENVNTILENKETASIENKKLISKLDEYKIYLEKLDSEILKKKEKVELLKETKIKHEQYKENVHKIDKMYALMRDYIREIEDNKKLLSDYEKNINLIEENEKLNILIKNIDLNLQDLKSKDTEFTNDIVSYSNQITLDKRVIEDLDIKLQKYREQQKIEEQHNVYLKLMHRTGLPTYLLTKNIDILNKELSGLLTNTDFTLFFDEDLNLRLQHNGKSGVINCIESSGMERTFSAIVLKIVLRIINFKSKPNFMFMDEIINRLHSKSIEKFMSLLEIIRTKIDKIVIIEHNVEIQSDMIISVSKDDDGISSFEII